MCGETLQMQMLSHSCTALKRCINMARGKDLSDFERGFVEHLTATVKESSNCCADLAGMVWARLREE